MRLGISFGPDPRAFFIMEAVRDGDGQFWLRLPHPERAGQSAFLLGRVSDPGVYWVKDGRTP